MPLRTDPPPALAAAQRAPQHPRLPRGAGTARHPAVRVPASQADERRRPPHGGPARSGRDPPGGGRHRSGPVRRAGDGPGIRPRDRSLAQRRLLLPSHPGSLEAPRAPALPGPRPLSGRSRDRAGGEDFHARLRSQPPQQSRLRHRRHLPRRPDHPVVRGGRMGALLATGGTAPRRRGFLRPPGNRQPALPRRAGGPREGRHRSRRAAGLLHRRTPFRRRKAGAPTPRPARLFRAVVRPRDGPRRGVRTGGRQLRPGDRGREPPVHEGPRPAAHPDRILAGERGVPRSPALAAPEPPLETLRPRHAQRRPPDLAPGMARDPGIRPPGGRPRETLPRGEPPRGPPHGPHRRP